MHHPRGALALVAVGSTLYAMGGAAGGEVAPVEAYDTIQNRWTDVATLPAPRPWGRLGVAGARLRRRWPLAEHGPRRLLRPDQRAGRGCPDLPFPTSGAGAAALGGQVIVAGGENAAESTLVDHVFRFMGGSAWSDEPMLVPRHGVQLAVFGGRAWACGGATAAGYHAATDCTSLARLISRGAA